MKINSKIIFALIFSLLLIYSANAQEINKYESLIIKINFTSSFLSESKTDMEVDLNLYPINDDRQRITEFYINGPGAVNEEKTAVKYEWHSINGAEFGWSAIIMTSFMKTSFHFPTEEHIPFPIKINSFEEYKKQTEKIDINSEITAKANEIVAGKNDWFEAIHSLGNYVANELTYDKSYVDSEQKASWVMKNKKGVCDEYTILFIALVRSLGIPAKYVSGVAYSNIDNNFGSHAWAEVYNGAEWIPFDTTFRQLGWLDATHVALSKTTDAQSSSAKYRYTASDITTSKLDVKAKVVGKGREFSGTEGISFKIEPLKGVTGSSSFIPLKVTVTNSNPYYVPLEIYIYRGIEVIGKNSMQILVPPLKTKTSFFILKTTETDKGYSYTSDIEARTQFNDAATTQIEFSGDYESMTLDRAKEIVESLREKDSDYKYDVNMQCAPLEDYYTGEEIVINCSISSESNAFLNALSLCVNEKCSIFDLPINGMSSSTFKFDQIAEKYIAKLSNKNISKTQLVEVSILKFPDIEVIDISPKTISYVGTDVKTLIRSNSICKSGVININGIEFDLGDIDKTTEYTISFNGIDALSKKLKVKARCIDLRGNIYKSEKDFDIDVTNVPWYAKILQKIIIFFEKK
ncbi:MAG: transglutaminase domain-containing protein [archaeon]